jgi:hypothetical protein
MNSRIPPRRAPSTSGCAGETLRPLRRPHPPDRARTPSAAPGGLACGLGALKSNPVYAARFAHLTGREHNKFSTGQAHAALAAALLRHLHDALTTSQRWDPDIAAGGRPDQTLNAA